MEKENKTGRRILIAGTGRCSLEHLCKGQQLDPCRVENIREAALMQGAEQFLFLVFFVQGREELQAAVQLGSLHQKSALLICPPDLYDMAVYLSRDSETFCITDSLPDSVFEQIVMFLSRSALAKEQLAAVLENEKKRRQEDQMVSRCKMQLIEQLHWSEQKAHDYIVHTAMANHASKARIARAIMRKLDAKKQPA